MLDYTEILLTEALCFVNGSDNSKAITTDKSDHLTDLLNQYALLASRAGNY